MSIKSFEFEGRFFRAKVPIPFVEATACLPSRIYVEGYFPVGTIFKFAKPVCSTKLDGYQNQVNDYCHAAALIYSNRYNGADEAEKENEFTFHVDLSAFFLLLEPVGEDGNPIAL